MLKGQQSALVIWQYALHRFLFGAAAGHSSGDIVSEGYEEI